MTEEVGRIGERELIERLKPWLTCGKQGEGLLGVGDDCAILPAQSDTELTVLTTDLLIENTHFLNTAATDWRGVGAKAATANISDIASMGARPVSMLVGLGIPAAFDGRKIDSLYQGMAAVAADFGVKIVGGDTTKAERLTIAVTVTGLKQVGTADCRRSDARAGDFVYVTGSLGGSRLGLEALLDENAGAAKHAGLHYYQRARVDLGLAMAGSFSRVAMIDISDGLFNEAGLISQASVVEVELELTRIPLQKDVVENCEKAGRNAHQFALYSGEEYELLFTVPEPLEAVTKILHEWGVDCPITQVGTVNSGIGVKLMKDGHPVDPKDETFVHFP